MHQSLPEDDHTDDDDINNLQSGARKRSSRACDQCRKTKSKCERSPDSDTQCKSCILAGTTCTFLGPSYKRGPPKGYIRAIEQRWHQVEALLGALIQCPDAQVQRMVATLKQDDLSREIIDRVDNGPYGPSGRLNQLNGATKEDFFASILRSNERSPAAPSTSRSRRQSRVSREIVSSSQDNTLAIIPTVEWQDSVSTLLTSNTNGAQRLASCRSYDEISGRPYAQRRRFNGSWVPGAPEQPDFNDMYTMDAASEEEEEDVTEETAQYLGRLSLDENSEVRYHGRASGLALISRNDRTDDRMQGGIWSLPMARVWPPSKRTLLPYSEDGVDEKLPPVEVQDHLLALYFTHVHPSFPVVNKERFFPEYNAKKHRENRGDDMDSPSSHSSSSSMITPKPEPTQKVSKLLLFSMFAVASRFHESAMPKPPPGKMWEAGFDYLVSARNILTKVFHRSKASTVQALLLLGHRDFGMGSMETAWANIGLAIRMAIDLGLNCNAEKWIIGGTELFSQEEVETRRQIWWACCLADRYGSVYMGRPICVREDDFDSPIPPINEEQDGELWIPLPSDPLNVSFPPVPSKFSSCCSASCKLIVIEGAIVTKAYPVRQTDRVNRKTLHTNLGSRLDQWYIELPEGLRFDTKSTRLPPPPHILFLHVRYWGAVLLLHRAFIPNWKDLQPMQSPITDMDTFAMKAFDLAQGAASHVSSTVAVWLETFTLRRSTAFLTSFVLSAGIMHILTLTLRSGNPSASLGLRQCLSALKDMSVTWPSAARAYDLLNGVNLQVASGDHTPDSGQMRNKRLADEAFGDRVSDHISRDMEFPPAQVQGTHLPKNQGIQDINQRIMVQMLGLDVPGVQPSTSFYPGYEWWPRQQQQQQPLMPSSAGQDRVKDVPYSLPMSHERGYMQEEVPSTNPYTTDIQRQRGASYGTENLALDDWMTANADDARAQPPSYYGGYSGNMHLGM